MTNNKQQSAVDAAELAMKLYPFSNSERNAFITGYNKAKEMELTPIELPSDEEIEASKFPLNSPEQELWNGGYEEGAKWMRNKIQGGEQ
jgi:hypothetical protein